MKLTTIACFVCTWAALSACEANSIPIDTAPFTGGCDVDNDCLPVSSDACDVCQTQRDVAIARSFGEDYATAVAEAAEGCFHPPSLESGPCPSSDALVEARCVDAVCVAVALEE